MPNKISRIRLPGMRASLYKMPNKHKPGERAMETQELTPPYLPFKTLTNLVERLADNGVPNRIDRSTLNHLSGITQTYLLAALRELNLINEDGTPTDTLIRLVKEPDERHAIIGDLVQQFYGAALALGTGATPAELDEVFT